MSKKEIRRRFRDVVFKRDGYRCVMCGFQSSKEMAEHELDAHHITNRKLMPNGGYVLENGITLCDPSKTGKPMALGCHYRAEERIIQKEKYGEMACSWEEYDSEILYKKIGSSYEKAFQASEYLK